MMKGLKRHLFLLTPCFFLLAWSPSAVCKTAGSDAEMTAVLVPNQTSVGGIITLTLKFRLLEGAHVTRQQALKGLEGFQILDRQLIPEDPLKTKDGAKTKGGPKHQDTPIRGEYRVRLLVNRLESGTIGPVTLSYVTAEGGKADLSAPPVSLTVLSNLGDTPEAAGLKPIYGIIPTQSFIIKYRFWILGGIVLLLLLAAFEWWLRNRRRKSASAVETTPPDKLAMRRLGALDKQRLFEEGRIKDFYFTFSEILRQYLEAIRGFPAAEFTLEEITRAVEKKEDHPLLALLRRADMIKFADPIATPAGKEEDMAAAFAYIRSTREQTMTEAAAERRGGKIYTANEMPAHKKARMPS